MRLPPALLAVVMLLLVTGTAIAARSHWIGAGVGTVSPGGGNCTAAFDVSIDRSTGSTSTWDIRILAAPTSPRDLCFLPSYSVYNGVSGSPQAGWRKVGDEPCGLRTITIGAIGNLPGGLTSLAYTNAVACGGGAGYATTIAFVARDPA